MVLDSLQKLLMGLGSSVSQSATSPNLSRYDPHKKQIRFHSSVKKGRLYIGGNRAGKTTANVTECLWWLTKNHPYRPDVNAIEGPVRGRLTCVDFGTLQKNIIPQFQQWTPKKWLIDGSWTKSYDKETKTLTLVNNSFIEFMSYDQDLDKFSGTSRHFVSFDEEGPEHIFNECGARLVDTGGSWWISMTPLDGLTWVYEKIYNPFEKQGDAFKFEVVQADMLDNPTIKPEEAESYLSTLSPQEREAREKGNFVHLGGRVFKNFDPKIHSMPISDHKLTKHSRVYTSVDVGWMHPTAWLWHDVQPDGSVITFHEMVESFRTTEDWAKAIHSFEKSRGIKVFMRTGDPAMRQTRSTVGVSDLMEYARHGLHIGVEGVPTGPGSVNVGLMKVEQYLKVNQRTKLPTWRYTDNCATLEDQMLRLRWEVYSSKKMQANKAPKGTIEKKDDDAPDSLRYFFTLMPDLSFDVDNSSIHSEHGALLASLANNNNTAMYSLDEMLGDDDKTKWSLYDAPSSWDMESLGD